MPAHHAKDSNSVPFAEDNLVNAVTVTATGAVGNPSSGWGNVDTIRLQAVLSSVTGTTPSYTLKLQESQDGTNWSDVPSGAFSAITAAGNAELSLAGPFDDIIRVFATVSGTTPSAVVTVNVASTVKVTHS